jgi:hypothetical protein
LIGASRNLATALDAKSMERLKANDRIGAAALRKRAAGFYVRCAAGATPSEVQQIAERLLVLGMIENSVPDTVESWIEMPSFEPKATPAWDGALQLYSQLEGNDALNWEGQVGYARLLGFTRKFNEAEAVLAKLFSRERITGANKRLDNAALQRKPKLLTAYLEWGYALTLSTGGDEKARRAKATDVFEYVANSVPVDKRHWWLARYGHMQSLFDRGIYDQADVSLSSLERTNPDFDGDRFGLKGRLRSLRLALDQKLPRKK